MARLAAAAALERRFECDALVARLIPDIITARA
jgi:hypothetical protein